MVIRAAWLVSKVTSDALFGFDRLVDTGAPLAPFGQSAGEFVDDDNLAVAYHVVPIEDHLAAHLDRTFDVLVDRRERQLVHGCRFGKLADQSATVEGQVDPLLLVVVLVVFVFHEPRSNLGRPVVRLGGNLLVLARQGADDERRASFVDQDAVGLVDQHEVQVALHRFLVRRRPHRRASRRTGRGGLRRCDA